MGLLEKIANIPELIKLENTLFVLPFTYIGMLLANSFNIKVFLLITLALVCARAAAFSMNRYTGKELDEKNPKKDSWKSVRIYSRKELLIVFIVFAAIFEAAAFELNLLSAELAPFVLIIVVLEPYAKRYTAHRHMLMGFVIGLGVLGGYVGASGTIPTTVPLYALLTGYMCFSAGSDIIYTMSHVDFDKKNGLKTYPVKYGINLSKQISKYLHYWAAALFIEFGAVLNFQAVVAAGIVSLFIFFFEHRNLSEKSERSIATTFFYYNAAVSLLMLCSVIISLQLIH